MRIIAIADWDVRLECVCADDFGAYYSGEESDENSANAQRYDETRDAHQRLKALCEERGIRHYVADTDDQDSKHCDAYLYFLWSKVKEVARLLEESGATGDVLDVPRDFPVELEGQAEAMGWSVERA